MWAEQVLTAELCTLCPQVGPVISPAYRTVSAVHHHCFIPSETNGIVFPHGVCVLVWGDRCSTQRTSQYIKYFSVSRLQRSVHQVGEEVRGGGVKLDKEWCAGSKLEKLPPGHKMDHNSFHQQRSQEYEVMVKPRTHLGEEMGDSRGQGKDCGFNAMSGESPSEQERCFIITFRKNGFFQAFFFLEFF